MYRLEAKSLSKSFGQLHLFKDLDISLNQGESLAVSGPNGSGKSTLVQILLGLEAPSRGAVTWRADGEEVAPAQRGHLIGFVAPYLHLYDPLSAEENLRFFASVTSGGVAGNRIDALLDQVGLAGRGHDLVGTYSSGMKQRLKYAVALLNEPPFLFLDEPTANLDDEGKKIVRSILRSRREDSVLVIATNEQEELELADQSCRLGV